MAQKTTDSGLTAPGIHIGGWGFLHGERPGIYEPVVEVLALIAEGPGGGPRLHDEVVGLVEQLPVEGGVGVEVERFAACASDEARHQPPAGYHVDFGQFLGNPQRVYDGQRVPQEHDLDALGDTGKDCGLQVHDRAQGEGVAVVLVEHDPVEPHLFRVESFIEVGVVQVAASDRIELGSWVCRSSWPA